MHWLILMLARNRVERNHAFTSYQKKLD
uniref:Uncharacterized protein n=1 Tax=Arundo donax TaxID=35708 RepID=A0A0A9G169_ARUDO